MDQFAKILKLTANFYTVLCDKTETTNVYWTIGFCLISKLRTILELILNFSFFLPTYKIYNSVTFGNEIFWSHHLSITNSAQNRKRGPLGTAAPHWSGVLSIGTRIPGTRGVVRVNWGWWWIFYVFSMSL